jgi:3-oxoacyl-(acyl-carrier-protein) synthase
VDDGRRVTGNEDGVTVVVTGLGVVSPIGIGTQEFWRHALAGTIGTGEITTFDTGGFHTHRGGEVKGFVADRFVRRIDPAQLPRSAQFAVAVARMALADGGLLDAPGAREAGVAFGTVLGNRPHLEGFARDLFRRHCLSIGALPAALGQRPSLAALAPACELGLGGPNVVLPTACAAGNSAVSYAMDLIRTGRAQVMVAGGTDQLSPAMFMMFNQFRALAPDFVRPFDRNRKGLMLAEGAAALLLESAAHARARGARIYCAVGGHGDFADAHHMMAPHPEGLGAARSMAGALAASGLEPADLDYINAHGTGTPRNDQVECRAVREVFGAAADAIPVSSLKAMIGHAQGAASAIEAVACVLAIRDGVVPANCNYETPDPECDLPVVVGAPLRKRVDAVLNNAFGFGGNVSCVVFTRLAAA